jgi:hypothetical protein
MIDPDKNSKFDFLLSRISDVDDHLKEVADQTVKKFNIIRDNVFILIIPRLTESRNKSRRKIKRAKIYLKTRTII